MYAKWPNAQVGLVEELLREMQAQRGEGSAQPQPAGAPRSQLLPLDRPCSSAVSL